MHELADDANHLLAFLNLLLGALEPMPAHSVVNKAIYHANLTGPQAVFIVGPERIDIAFHKAQVSYLRA
jgi:hypothetical protein